MRTLHGIKNLKTSFIQKIMLKFGKTIKVEIKDDFGDKEMFDISYWRSLGMYVVKNPNWDHCYLVDFV